MENQSMFEQANQNTLEIMKKLVIFEDNMTEQLNFLAKQALISAKTEVAFAQIENIPFERLSTLAQQVYKNPDFILEKKFALTDLINAPAKEQDIFEEFKRIFRPGHYGQFYEDAWFDRYCYVRVKDVVDFNFVPF